MTNIIIDVRLILRLIIKLVEISQKQRIVYKFTTCININYKKSNTNNLLIKIIFGTSGNLLVQQ